VATVCQNQGTKIDGIAFAVFAEFGVCNPVTAAALVRTVGIDAAQHLPQRGDAIESLDPDPSRKRFRHRAPQDRCRPDLDALAVG
jgi:hypothetical protein